MFLTLIAGITPPPLLQAAPQVLESPTQVSESPIQVERSEPIVTGPTETVSYPNRRHPITIGPVAIDFTSLPIHMYGYALFTEHTSEKKYTCWLPIRYDTAEANEDGWTFENLNLDCNPNRAVNGFIVFKLYDRRLPKWVCTGCSKNIPGYGIPTPRRIKGDDEFLNSLKISVKNGVKWADAPRRRPTLPTRTFGQQAF